LSKEKLDKFVNQTTMIFKSYEHSVMVSKTKSNLWHFSSTYNQKKYNIYCTLSLSKVKSLIKIALKKTTDETRLVVICNKHSEEDKESADEAGYSLIEFSVLQEFGTDIIEARAKDAMKAS
jgi:hypothetical protein